MADGLPIYRAGLAYAKTSSVLLGSYRATILAGTYPGWPALIPGELLQWSGANYGFVATADSAQSVLRFFLNSGSVPADGVTLTGLTSGATCKVVGVASETRWATEARLRDEVSLDGELGWHEISAIAGDAQLTTSGLTPDTFGGYGIVRSWTPFHRLARMAAGESLDPNSILTRNLDWIDSRLHLQPLFAYATDVELAVEYAGALVVVLCATSKTLTLPDGDRAGIGWTVNVQNAGASAAILTVEPLGAAVLPGQQSQYVQIGRYLGGVSPTHGWIALKST